MEKKFECKEVCVKQLNSINFSCEKCIKHTQVKLTKIQKEKIMKMLLTQN